MYFDITQKSIFRKTFLLSLIFVNITFAASLFFKYANNSEVSSYYINVYNAISLLIIPIFWLLLCIWEKEKEKAFLLFSIELFKILLHIFLQTTWMFYINIMVEFVVVFLYFNYKQQSLSKIKFSSIIFYFILSSVLNFVLEIFNHFFYELISNTIVSFFFEDFQQWEAHKYLVFDLRAVLTFITPYLALIVIFMAKNFQKDSRYFKNILFHYFQVSRKEFLFLFFIFSSLFFTQAYILRYAFSFIVTYLSNPTIDILSQVYYITIYTFLFIISFLALRNLVINRILSTQIYAGLGIEYFLAFIPILNIISFFSLAGKKSKVLINFRLKQESLSLVYSYIVIFSLISFVIAYAPTVNSNEFYSYIGFMYQVLIIVVWLIFIQQKNAKYILLLLYTLSVFTFFSSNQDTFYSISTTKEITYLILSIKIVLPFIFEKVLFFEVKHIK